MSKIVIGIHGLGNKPNKKLLEKWWRESLGEGLRTIGKNIVNPKFKMIYWADILYEKLLDEKINNKDDPYYIEERYIPCLKRPENNAHTVRKKILDFLEKGADKIFLNEDLSLNYSFIFSRYIHKHFRDLEIYYSNEPLENYKEKKTAKNLIRNRTAEIIRKHKNDEIFLIGHSMGSIIAYDVLTFLIPDVQIDTFVTLGSPLGQPFIISKIGTELKSKGITLKKLKTPPGVINGWYNFSDLEDMVAVNYNLADDYVENDKGIKPVDIQVNNNYEVNGRKNPHKSYGYLRTAEFSTVLYEFLLHGKSKTAKWFINTANKIYSSFKKSD